jgi:plasmid maintenance system antidote protein VapI
MDLVMRPRAAARHIRFGIFGLALPIPYWHIAIMTYQAPYTQGAVRLAEEMAKREWRDADLAKHIGCSQPHATRLRTGARLPSKALMFRLQDVCDIPPRDWLTEATRDAA